MSYPKLEINVRKLEYNARVEVRNLAKVGVTVMGVNKVFNGLPETAEAIVRGGIKTVAESRVSNLKKIENIDCEKCLLRSPLMSDIEDTVKYADISLNSEIEVIRALSQEAVKQEKTHKILLMIDMGDIREGIWFENKDEIKAVVNEIKALPNLEIYGLGTNFNCFGTALPTVKNGVAFRKLASEIEESCGVKFQYLSAGNCTSYHLIDKGIWPEGLNHLRIGGLHLYGMEYVSMKYLDEYYHSDMDITGLYPIYMCLREKSLNSIVNLLFRWGNWVWMPSYRASILKTTVRVNGPCYHLEDRIFHQKTSGR